MSKGYAEPVKRKTRRFSRLCGAERRLPLYDDNCHAEMEISSSDSSLDNPRTAVFVFAHDASSKPLFLLRSLEEVQGSFGLNQPDLVGRKASLVKAGRE